MSRKLILGMSISLDGFVAGPNGEADWIFANRGPDSTQWIVDGIASAGLIIMGRGSYEAMATYWPTSTLPFAGPMNRIPKMVFSRSGALEKPISRPPLSPERATFEAENSIPEAPQPDEAVWDMWLNPQVGGKDLAAEIRSLKELDGKPISALGGASFAAGLIEHNLVDEFHLIVHPVALGKGLPIFDRLPDPLRLRLIELREFKSGAVAKVFELRKDD